MMTIFLIPLAALVFLPAAAAEELPLQPVMDCLERNTPPKATKELVEFRAFDRNEGERKYTTKVLGKRSNGTRKSKFCWKKPHDMREMGLLIRESEIKTKKTPDLQIYLPDTRKWKVVSATGAASSIFGTDFTPEDLAEWRGHNQSGTSTRLSDAKIQGRDVYRIARVPDPEAKSAYTRVLSFVDQKWCVPLRVEYYEKKLNRMRKVLSADPDAVIPVDSIWVATELRMDDLVDKTHTEVSVEDIELDGRISDQTFLPIAGNCR